MDAMANPECLVTNPEREISSCTPIGEKVPAYVDESSDPRLTSSKRQKTQLRHIQRVAEAVLVLSAMSGIRGGRSPTETEQALMEEAKETLMQVCLHMAPKDLVTKHAVSSVIEDLGLNRKGKYQIIGFTGSRLSIKEKMSLAMKKMEEHGKLVMSSTCASQKSHPNVDMVTESHGPSHTARMIQLDKAHSSPVLSGAFPVQASAANSMPITYISHSSDGRVYAGSAGLPSGHPERTSSAVTNSKNENTQFRVEDGSNVASYELRSQNTSSHPVSNVATWSIQSQPSSVSNTEPLMKAQNHSAAKIAGTSGLSVRQSSDQPSVRGQTFRPFVTQNASAKLQSPHQPAQQGMPYLQSSSPPSNPAEISKMVLKLLQAGLSQHPAWTPPSTEYMNKALMCQMCKFFINEVDNVVICDGCEKGFHLKCLGITNEKGITGDEWHCMKCTALSNGKPLPPKYGRVVRSLTVSKGMNNVAGGQSSIEKKAGSVDSNANQEPILSSNAASDPINPETLMTTGVKDVAFPGKPMKSLGASYDSHNGISEDPKVLSSDTLSKESVDKHDHGEPSCIRQGADEDEQTKMAVSADADADATVKGPAIVEALKSEEGKTRADSSEANAEAAKLGSSPSDGMQNIEWIGGVLEVMDERMFYGSCCINGVTYKLLDHCFIHSNNNMLMIPSKLQLMWEDVGTGSKWVNVSQCYFPGDLPEGMGHPNAPGTNEVYESNHESCVLACLIQGPCKVLPPSKYREELQMSNQLGTEANSGSRSIFLCRWFYDEKKGNFQPIFG